MNKDITNSRMAGLPTFMQAPFSRELKEVDLCIVGAPLDTGGAIRSGARLAPDALRKMSRHTLRPINRFRNIAVRDVLRIIDYGDLSVIQESIEQSYAVIEEAISRISSANVTPMVIGGDHSVSLPVLRGLCEHNGPLSLVHFDAHLDIVDSYYDGRIRFNNGTVFRRAVEEGLINPATSIQIGQNGGLYEGMRKEHSQALGFQVVTIEEAIDLGNDELLKTIETRIGDTKCYLSFDIDVMDVSVAPGSGAPEVGGFLTREILFLLRRLSLDLVGADIVEVNPLYDSADMTSALACNIVYEIISMIAARKLESLDA